MHQRENEASPAAAAGFVSFSIYMSLYALQQIGLVKFSFLCIVAGTGVSCDFFPYKAFLTSEMSVGMVFKERSIF